MYLAISIAFAAAGIAEAAIQARRAARLDEALHKTETEAKCFQSTAKDFETRFRAEETTCRALASHADLLQKALGESEDSCCRLRKTVRDTREELACEVQAHDSCTKMLSEVKDELDRLKTERRKLEDALIAEKEKAEHWKEEHEKEYYARLTTEGRVAREWANMLSYDGTAKGQKDVEEYPDEY